MKKRFLCVLIAAALLLGALAGCGSGSSGGSDPNKPGVGSTKPNKGSNTNDPAAVMQERIKAVNDAVNYECVGIEEMVEAGLLFYGVTYGHSGRGPYDYNPDKPLDYAVSYQMYIGHAEGLVNEDTYVALLKAERYTEDVDPSDVIETDGLYVYYSPQISTAILTDGTLGTRDYRPWCYILVKGTDIVYLFTVSEACYKANYYEYEDTQPKGTIDLNYDDAEYIFTAEFWKAFSQTAKFVGNPDDDLKKGEYVNTTVRSINMRSGYIPISSYDESRYIILDMDDDEMEVRVRIPYIEERYAEPLETDVPVDDSDAGDLDAIYAGFEEFLENCNEEDGFLVIDDFGQGKPTMFFNNGLYTYAGGGKVTLIYDFADIDDEWMSMSTNHARTQLMFGSGDPLGDDIKIVDLKTFEVTDRAYISYDLDSDNNLVFLGGAVDGAPVDEETALAACNEWRSICCIHLLGRGGVGEINLGAAWREYENRE